MKGVLEIYFIGWNRFHFPQLSIWWNQRLVCSIGGYTFKMRKWSAK